MNSDLNPAGSNAFVTAVHWLDGLLLGSLASLIAVIAIASVGLLLLSGRIDVRRGVQVIFGCFIIFGASPIAGGIVGVLGRGGGSPYSQASALPPPAYPSAPSQSPRASSPYDPYASIALQPRY